jgi:V/A-type H+-transporting ATPase subunit D
VARKISLNKTELSRLRREEKTYKQYLPVLRLKQEQLQVEQLKLVREVRARRDAHDEARASLDDVLPLLAEDLPVAPLALARAREVVRGHKSVAGVVVPTLEHVAFDERDFSRFGTPPWVALTLPRLRALVRLHTELTVLEEQLRLITHELKRATQKVNLFEKVLLPETREGIRRIEIRLGDERVAAVGRGKLAKKKQRHQAAPAPGPSAGSHG